jgi:predicted ATP-grasp superfamily ATP-dependent carboligase
MKRCYKVVEEHTKRVTVANLTCKDEGAVLMKADEVDEIMLAFQTTKKYNQNIWLDGYDPEAMEVASQKYMRKKEKHIVRQTRTNKHAQTIEELTVEELKIVKFNENFVFIEYDDRSVRELAQGWWFSRNMYMDDSCATWQIE